MLVEHKKPPGKVLLWPQGTSEAVREYELRLDSEWRFIALDAEVAATRDYPLLGVKVWDAWPDLVGSKVHTEYCAVMKTRIPRLFDNYYEPMQARHRHWVYPLQGGGIMAHIEEFKVAEEEKLG